MQNNDLHSNINSGSERIPSDSSSVEYGSLMNHGYHSHYQSMATIQNNRPSIISSIGNALKIVSIAIICIVVVLGTLAKITHGKALFLDKVEGEIIEREIIIERNPISRGISECKVKIAYTYNGKEYVINRQSDATKLVGEKVYVYVNMLDPSKAIYFDPLSLSFIFVPLVVLVFVVLYQKFSRDILPPYSPRSWW